MTSQKRYIINNIAELIRNKINLSTPVDMEVVVKELNGKVEEMEFENPTISGLIKKTGDSFVIYVNPNDIPERRTFTIAHEIGHLFLHMGYLVNMNKWNSINEYTDSPMFRQGYSEEEYEANEFAAAFLMPSSEFKSYREQNLSLEDIAKKFHVSKEAALTRGRWLGMYGWN